MGFGAILCGIFGVIFLLLNWAPSQPVAAAPHLPFAWFARLAASALPAVLSLGLPLPSSGAQFRRECCCDGRWRRRRGRERPKSLFLFFPLSTFPLFTERRRKEGRKALGGPAASYSASPQYRSRLRLELVAWFSAVADLIRICSQSSGETE